MTFIEFVIKNRPNLIRKTYSSKKYDDNYKFYNLFLCGKYMCEFCEHCSDSCSDVKFTPNTVIDELVFKQDKIKNLIQDKEYAISIKTKNIWQRLLCISDNRIDVELLKLYSELRKIEENIDKYNSTLMRFKTYNSISNISTIYYPVYSECLHNTLNNRYSFFSVNNNIDLVTHEEIMFELVDLMILYLQSPGTHSELGGFSFLDKYADKLIVVNNKCFEGEKSYINDGPIKKIKRINNNRSQDSVFFLDFYDNEFSNETVVNYKIKNAIESRKNISKVININHKSKVIEVPIYLFKDFIIEILDILSPMKTLSLNEIINEFKSYIIYILKEKNVSYKIQLCSESNNTNINSVFLDKKLINIVYYLSAIGVIETNRTKNDITFNSKLRLHNEYSGIDNYKLFHNVGMLKEVNAYKLEKKQLLDN